ncbi:MAG TPA: sulfatase-like hydrolase/transferase [Geminicoccaceae bacterium]|nr:sulfatase-like hydrolase/transferase [Geminicoccaceae bacterium]
MQASNVLVIMSDQHSRRILGCYGNDVVQTPNLDRLAGRGTRFTDAYCNCPICVPSRASFATGRYVHDIRYWDNAHPYDGRVPGWGQRLIETGHQVVSIGKLHYRDTGDPVGLSEQILPLNVVDGVGDLQGLLRRQPQSRPGTRVLARDAGRGESTYTDYDRKITAAACDWLRTEAPKYRSKPWVLFVSLVCPHFPLIAPPEFFDLYPLDRLPWPKLREPAHAPRHPVLQALRKVQNFDDHFRDEQHVRTAVAAYYGLCSFVDHHVGRILETLEGCGLMGKTRIVYTSDHGDNLGKRGFWNKSVMYEESAGVPLILAGPDVPAGRVVGDVGSLVDAYPTLIEATGETLTPEERRLPGHSWLRIANGDAPSRTVLCEYHAVGSITGTFMIRMGRWKYVYYVGYPPQLFDLETDPEEANDLGQSAAHAEVLAACEAKLRSVVDPEAASELAFRDQGEKIAKHGGEEAVRRRGHFPYTPAPGEAPSIHGAPPAT